MPSALTTSEPAEQNSSALSLDVATNFAPTARPAPGLSLTRHAVCAVCPPPGVTLAECGESPDEATYAELSLSAIRWGLGTFHGLFRAGGWVGRLRCVPGVWAGGALVWQVVALLRQGVVPLPSNTCVERSLQGACWPQSLCAQLSLPPRACNLMCGVLPAARDPTPTPAPHLGACCRNARRNWTAENHLYNLLHRGFTAEPRGHAACPFDFYK